MLFQKVIYGNIVNKVRYGNKVNMMLKIIEHPIYNTSPLQEKEILCNKAFCCHKIIIKWNADKGNCLMYIKLQETTNQNIML